MNTTNYIRIFRGDDSDALGYQTIVGTIKTDLDLTGCKAVFRFLGFYAEFNPVPEDKKLTIVIPAQASRGFPPGVGYASLKVLDSLGKIRTFTNRIPVIVDTMTPSCGCGEFEISFSPFPELEPLKIFIGPNADDFDQYTGFVSKIIDRASLVKYGLAMLADAMSEDGGASGKAASPLAVKAAYDAIITELTNNYYTAAETDEAINSVTAYYITRNADGEAFSTKAQLDSTTVFYSGGKVRVPTRNDYCVVLADETHDNAEYRYIYAVAEGETIGSWEAQYPVGGTMTIDSSVTKNSSNPVTSSGIWSALWGTATTTFSSVYDWVVSKLSEYRDKLDLAVYGFGNATVALPDRFSITYYDQTYTAPVGGETIIFVGPVPSSNEYSPNYKFYYPSSLGTLDSFDPNDYSVWCLVCSSGGDTPDQLMYKTGPSYSISGWNSAAPTLTLSNGEATGDAPTMARPLGATGDTLAKVSQIPSVSGFAPLDSPALTGTPTAPTAASGTNTTQVATTAFVQGAVSDKADVSAIPYDLGTPTVIDTASSEVVEGETVYYGAATLANRTANIVQVTAATALDELRITFPAATSGKVRDFGLRVEIGTGSAALAAPALVPIAPTGETIKIENNAAEIPALADGTATAKGVTLLYFSENAPGVFVVKGEQVEEVA